MEKVELWTTFLWNACGGLSNIKTFILNGETLCPHLIEGWRNTLAFTPINDRTKVWMITHRLLFISPLLAKTP